MMFTFWKRATPTIIEIFHLFNALVNKNAQIILSSDQPPTQLDKMDARIRTRLNSGVVIDIEQPKEEDMRIVCVEMSQKLNLNISDDAIEYIVEKVSRNIREMSGALKSIHLHSADNPGKRIVLDDVKKFIKNYIRPKNTASCDGVIESVCDFYGIQKDVLTTKTRRERNCSCETDNYVYVQGKPGAFLLIYRKEVRKQGSHNRDACM